MFAVKLSIHCLVCFVLIVVLVDAKKDQNYYSIDKAVYLAQGCNTQSLKLQCQQQCGDNHGCIFGKCFCLQHAKERIYVQNLLNQESPGRPTGEDQFLDFDDYTEMTPTIQHDPGEVVHKTALRHHIAHFCADLEEARKCIRGCMKVGKPAFCGKDHICYCGHQYTNPGEDKKVNAANIYSQYQDLYKKYFGAQFSTEEDH